MKSPLKEVPTHPVISLLHIQLDRHEASSSGGMLKVMHELLDKQDIINDEMRHPNKGTQLWTDEMRHNQLQPPNQGPSTYLVEGGAKYDRSKVTRNRNITSLGNKSNISFLPLNRDTRVKDRLHHLNHLSCNNGPAPVEEKRREAI